MKDINWLYKDVREDSVDEAVQDMVEVVKKTSSTLLKKATKEDISNLQCYTIRNLSTKQFTGDDIEQYKLMYVKEEPIESSQKYLDVMCFPTLFPEGNFGKFHDRQKIFSHSEYIKSRLLNKDSRFRKDPRYVFYLLWHKELREVSAGVYNLLKSHKARPMSASSLINRLQLNDELLETNLSTMLQTVHGTTQFWFKSRASSGAWCVNLACPLYFSPSAVQSTTLMTLLTTSKLSTMCLKAMTWESCALKIPFQSPGSSHSSFTPSSTKS